MKIIKLIILLIYSSSLVAQLSLNDHKYSRQVDVKDDNWIKIHLDNHIQEYSQENFNDVRLVGVKESDTVPLPYLIFKTDFKEVKEVVSLKRLNDSKQNKYSYTTFSNPDKKLLSDIKLNFQESNFDTQVLLEGSNDGEEWFTILEDYRIFSFKNNGNYQSYSKLVLPPSNYKFFRIRYPSDLKLLNVANYLMVKEINRGFKEFSFSVINDGRKTILELKLREQESISDFKINIPDSKDFRRSCKLLVLEEIKGSHGNVREYWNSMYSFTISSDLKNVFSKDFRSKAIRLEIDNKDDLSLEIESIELRLQEYFLYGRFKPMDDYYLLYGNNQLTKPNYDLRYYPEKVDTSVVISQLGGINILEQVKLDSDQNTDYLMWSALILVLLLMTAFAFNLLKKAS